MIAVASVYRFAEFGVCGRAVVLADFAALAGFAVVAAFAVVAGASAARFVWVVERLDVAS